MFYSQDILQRRGGKFGIIWIAATKGDRLSKREYCSVDIARTCEDIIRYITLQVAPLPHGSRPRLSLYLASQLMFGTVAVFEKQSEYLYVEATYLSKKFHRLPDAEKAIQLNALPRPELLPTPDVDAFLACDFEFGSLRFSDLIQPSQIPMMDVWMIQKTPSPRADIALSGAVSPILPFRPEIGSPHQVSIDSITLKESPIPDFVIPQMPEEHDLPPPVEEQEEKLMDVTLPPDMMLPSDVSSHDIDNQMLSPVDTSLPPISDTEAQLWEPAEQHLLSPGVTPIEPDHPHPRRKKRPSTTMVLLPATPSPIQRKRRRQLLFADRDTQIDRRNLKQNLLNGAATCTPMVLPDLHCSTVPFLFSQPSRRMVSARLIHLWERNTVTVEVGETDSEKAVPSWTVPELGESTSSESDRNSPASRSLLQQFDVLSPVAEREEMLAEVTGKSFASIEQVMTASRDEPQFGDVTIASMSSRDSSAFRPHSSLNITGSSFVQATPERVDPTEPGLELRTTTEQLGVLQAVVEEPELIHSPELPLDPASPEHTHQHQLIRNIYSLTRYETWTTFKQVCPLTYSKRDAAQMFSALLDMCGQQRTRVRQNAFYQDIFITRGTRW